LTGQLHKARAELEHLRLQLSVREDRERVDGVDGYGSGLGMVKDGRSKQPGGVKGHDRREEVMEQLGHKCVQLELELKVCVHALGKLQCISLV
jgi:hypothetical protein